MTWDVHHGDSREVLAGMPAESVDSCVTDPPYELGFMGKKWDSTGIAYDVGFWRAVLRVLKPGAHLCAFGGSRTYHRMAVAIEDAGFEIRDSLMWIYGTGFPKSLNLPGGIGTALKPAHEPVILARKPLRGTVAANVLQHGVGGLNIDATRVETTESLNGGAYAESGGRSMLPGDEREGAALGMLAPGKTTGRNFIQPAGRWPANVCLDEEAAAMLDAQSGELTSGVLPPGTVRANRGGWAGPMPETTGPGAFGGDSGGASRFFYVAKPSRFDRDAGLDDLPSRTAGEATDREDGSEGLKSPRAGAGRTSEGVKNHHPTVKPVLLMEWLVRLVTPPGGLVLDPFLGSGTTGAAAVRQAFRFVGIEREAEYIEIAKRRIDHWSKGQLDLAGRVA